MASPNDVLLLEGLEPRLLLDGDAWSGPPLIGNAAPTADYVTYSLAEDTVLQGQLTGSDPDGGPITFALVSGPGHGTLTLNAAGQFAYTPAANWYGGDSFIFRTSDGVLQSDLAAVAIMVSPVNDAPVAAPDAKTTAEDTAVTTASVLANDTDADGDALSVASFLQPAHGTVVYNGNGTFTYTPAANWHGTDSFTYVATDGREGAVGTVTITVTPVNDAPTASNQGFSGIEDTQLQGQLVATDVDGDSLTFLPMTNPAHGTLSLQADGRFTYTPAANWYGTDSFTFRVSDGTVSSATRTVTLTIAANNHAPTMANQGFTTNEDTTLAGQLVAGDADGDALTFSRTTQAAHGSVTVYSSGAFAYVPGANWNGTDSFTCTVSDGRGGTRTATVTVTVAAVNDAPVANAWTGATNEDTPLAGQLSGSDVEGSALTFQLSTGPGHGTVTLQAGGQFVYTPSANWYGTDSFTFRANDGQLVSSARTVTITVAPVNDPPSMTGKSLSTPEDTPVTTVLTPTDVDGDTLTFSIATQPAHGTASVQQNGTLTYTPAANWHGTETFACRVSDGHGATVTASITVTVQPVNDAPVATVVQFAGTQDQWLSGQVGATDADGDALTFELADGPAHGTLALQPDGRFLYEPNSGWYGTDTFRVRISDGTVATAAQTVTLAIQRVNAVPAASDRNLSMNEDGTLTGVLTATDADGDTLSFSAAAQPAHGTLALTNGGAFAYAPHANWHGTDSFRYIVSDGFGGSATATVTITVASVNDAPVAGNDAVTGTEDVPLTIPNPLANDTDADGDALTIASFTQPAHGTLARNANGTFTYTPAANWYGTDSFGYVADDGHGGSDSATVTITVQPVNDAPTVHPKAATTSEDSALTGTLTGSDAEGSALSFSVVTGPLHGTLTLLAGGSFTYVPHANWHGTDSFTFRASDGGAYSSAGTATLTVTPVNDAPQAHDDAATTEQDATLVIPSVLTNDVDIDGDALTLTAFTQAGHGTVEHLGNGSFRYRPASGWYGTDHFTYTVSDGKATSTATVAVTVNHVEWPVRLTSPTASAAINRGGGYSITWDGGEGDETIQLWSFGPAGWTRIADALPVAQGSYTFSTAGQAHGWYCFRAWVNPGAGEDWYAVASPDWLNVVLPTNRTPTLRFRAPGAMVGVTQGQPFTVAWDTADADGDAMHVALWAWSLATGWFQPAGTEWVASPNGTGGVALDTTNLPTGWYQLAGWVWDGSIGGSAVSDGWLQVTAPPATGMRLSFRTPTTLSVKAGGKLEIRWDADTAALANPTLSLWAYSNATGWLAVSGTLEPATGTYTWNTTGMQAGTYSLAAWMGAGETWLNFLSSFQITLT